MQLWQHHLLVQTRYENLSCYYRLTMSIDAGRMACCIPKMKAFNILDLIYFFLCFLSINFIMLVLWGVFRSLFQVFYYYYYWFLNHLGGNIHVRLCMNIHSVDSLVSVLHHFTCSSCNTDFPSFLKEGMTAGYCFGKWKKPSTPESSQFSWKGSIILTSFAWLSTVATQKYSLEVRRSYEKETWPTKNVRTISQILPSTKAFDTMFGTKRVLKLCWMTEDSPGTGNGWSWAGIR